MSNSLKETANNLEVKINEIRMTIKYPSNLEKAFVLLEGGTDIKLFRNIFDLDNVNTTALEGKAKVVEALQKLYQEGFRQIIALKDADFDHLEGCEDIEHLFLTDYHDMEVTMVESEAFISVINEYSKEDNYSDSISKLKSIIYPIALIIGYLRWFNETTYRQNGTYTLLFHGLNFNTFIILNNNELIFNQEKFLDELIAHSKKKNISLELTKQDLQEKINVFQISSTNEQQICSGHDLTKLIAMILLKSPNGDEIEKALRLSYSLEYFKNTTLFNLLMAWSSTTGKRLFLTL